MSWHWILIAFVLGGLGGYILKDQLSEEYISNVTMFKPKVKGRQNRQDLSQVAEVTLKKMSRKQKREARRKARKAKRNS